MNYSNWQYNGLVFGNGTNIEIDETDGLDDLPPVRTADLDKAGDMGSFPGLDLLGERTLTIKLALLGQDRPTYDALVLQLLSAFSIQAIELPLYCGDNGSQIIYCRPRRLALPRKREQHGTFNVAALVELTATDPRKYSAIPTTVSTTLASQSGGMTFNATFPVSFGTVGAGGTVSLTNAGNFQTPLQFTILGPVTNPILDNLTTGQSLLFTITLATGDTLVITGAGTSVVSIILNGTASRRSSLLSSSAPLIQFGLPGGAPGPCVAGITQQFRYRNNGALTASTMTVGYSSAWA